MRVGGLLVTMVLAGSMLLPVPAAAQEPPHPPTDPGDLRVEAGIAPGSPVPDPRPGEAFADPVVADLQRAASQVQRELGQLSGQIQGAQQKVDQAASRLATARAQRERAEAALAAQQQEIDQFSRSVFTAMGRADEFRLLVTAASPEELLGGTSLLNRLRVEQDQRLVGALTRQREAVAAERAAEADERAAAESVAELERRSGDATNRADAVSAELRDPIDAANAAVVAQQRAQQQRNSETAASWRAYLGRLDAAGIEPPPAATLRDPALLPAGLRALPGKDGKPQAGVAQIGVNGQRLLVLPRETINAVSAAVEALGRPYVPREGGEGPVAYSCDGLVRSVFTKAGLALPPAAAEQFARGRPVPAADAQPGDLVFVGPARYGVQSVGIVLDERTMLVADARLAGVVVADRPAGESLLGVVRPALGQRSAGAVPQRADGELTWRCGGVELPPRRTGAAGADEAAGAWGGYPNGLIPGAAMCPIGVGSHVLRCDAAQSFQAMSRAYAATFGETLCLTDSYRTFSAQVDLYRRKPSLAAVPGTSNHGWGLAVDLCGGAESFGTPQYGWLAVNARAFGWVNPGWARQGGGREEPWHWEFVGTP
ncbi:D-alanyl-D-alanine carboxypeptidase [Prauserella sp. PE36]|uniref:D-alanyl-D-alanine carboxypeptidase n=1 Tax=Prauserella endophytica TaxID=1592324 RepID=A0ABY2S6G1_9PSEU|nr:MULTISPECIES: D-alanyl-D-alanine carboxypeptidase family protein [Prauserella]RBM20091.1 D-alanyl-D-alanine carboxypeptidase [Prauserella sp. PE36]TKG71497.1 D-alanyl-D-alanine carboxypeptidase [Prauserella endophytica]